MRLVYAISSHAPVAALLSARVEQAALLAMPARSSLLSSFLQSPAPAEEGKLTAAEDDALRADMDAYAAGVRRVVARGEEILCDLNLVDISKV